MDKETIDQLHIALLKRQRGKRFLQSAKGKLIESLSRELSTTILEIKKGLGQLVKDGRILEGVTLSGDTIGKIVIAGEYIEPLTSRQTKWLEIVHSFGFTDDDNKYLKCFNMVSDLTEDDMILLVSGIRNIIDNPQTDADPYSISARNLLGSSKALKNIGKPFGLPEEAFSGRVSYFVMAGPDLPSDARSLLFIENQAPFELFCDSEAIKSSIGVATFGYGVTIENIAKDWDNQRIKPLVRQGNPPDLGSIPASLPKYYWGDLDRAGLDIYLKIKSRLPELQLSALYKPMIEMIKNIRTSHPYCNLAKKGDQVLQNTSDPLVLKLAEYCKDRAVDQEAVLKEDIERLFDKPLAL